MAAEARLLLYSVKKYKLNATKYGSMLQLRLDELG